jgi:plastocyanin
MRSTKQLGRARLRSAVTLLAAVAAGAALVVGPASAAIVEVRIDRTGFVPATVTVAAGDTVRWTNRDSVSHQVVSDTGVFASPTLAAGQSFSFVFQNAGTFRYRDALKPAERGTVRVTEPPPAVSLAATAPILVFGAESRLQGVTSAKRAGEQVTLLQQPHGQSAYTQAMVATTGPNGVFDVAVRPTILTAYVAQYRGVNSGEIRIEVRPKITLLPGRRGYFLARVSGGHSFAGRYVFLQRRNTFGQWVSIVRYRLGINSGKLFRIPKRRGVVRYRIFMTVNQAGVGYLESWSGTQTVRRT